MNEYKKIIEMMFKDFLDNMEEMSTKEQEAFIADFRILQAKDYK